MEEEHSMEEHFIEISDLDYLLVHHEKNMGKCVAINFGRLLTLNVRSGSLRVDI